MHQYIKLCGLQTRAEMRVVDAVALLVERRVSSLPVLAPDGTLLDLFAKADLFVSR